MGPGTPRPAVALHDGSTAGERGFTLVELILVLLVVGVLGVVAIPRMIDLDAWRLRAYGDELLVQTQAMQRLALVQRRPVIATIDGGGVDFAYAGGATLLDLPCPAALTPCIAEPGPRTITFNSGNTGRAVSSTGSALPLTLSHGGTTLALHLETETGLIRRLP